MTKTGSSSSMDVKSTQTRTPEVKSLDDSMVDGKIDKIKIVNPGKGIIINLYFGQRSTFEKEIRKGKEGLDSYFLILLLSTEQSIDSYNIIKQ